MKAAAIYLSSFLVGALLGLFLAWFGLAAMTGFPNRSGGGSWDIGPVVFPVMSAPAYLLAHPISFAAFRERPSVMQRALLSAFVAAIFYAFVVCIVARAIGYR